MYNKTLPELYSSYRVVTDLMMTFGLVMEHDKSEIFHFSRAHNDSNPELDLSAIGVPTLKSKNDTQCACLKGPLLDTEVSLLNLTECFNPLHAEATPGFRLLDSFSNYISFHPCNCSSLRDCKTHLQSLDHLCLEASSSSSTLVVVTDASIILSRHMQAVSTVHLWNLGQQVSSSKAPASRTTTSDAKLFAISVKI